MKNCKHSVCTEGDPVEAAQRAVAEVNSLGSAIQWIHNGIKVMIHFGFNVPRALVAYFDAKKTLEASADRALRRAKDIGRPIKWKMGSVLVRVEPDATIDQVMADYHKLRTT